MSLSLGERPRLPPVQYLLSTLRHDGGSVAASNYGQLCTGITVCLMIDLHGHVTDKDYEAISNGRCSLGCKHCSIMMSPHSTRHYYIHTHCYTEAWQVFINAAHCDLICDHISQSLLRTRLDCSPQRLRP